MRWGYLVPRVVIVAAIWCFFVFGFDPLLRWGTVQSGQQMTGAKVDVDSLGTTFFPPTIGIGRVQLASAQEPMTNLIEFDAFRFHLDGDALSHRKVVIDEGTLTGLKFGTARTDSGALPNQPVPDPEEETGPGMFDGLGDKAKELGDDWLEEMMSRVETATDPYQFESVRLADGMHKDWKSRFESYKDRIDFLEKRVKQLEKTIKNAKGSTLERIQEYDKARREINELLAEADRIRRELPMLAQQANDDYRAIDIARQNDLNELRRKLDDFKLDAETISDALIGPEMRERMATTIEWVQWFRKKMAAVKNQPKPERYRGVDVDFSLPNDLPLFLVKQLKLTGEADVGGELVPFKGLVHDVTSDPVLYGKPIVVQLYGKKSAVIQVKAIIDHTVDTPVYDVAIAYSLPEQTEMQLGKQSKVMLNVAALKTDWKAKMRLEGDQLTGDVKLWQSPVRFAVDVQQDMRPEIKRMLESSLSQINDLEATIHLSGPYKRPKLKVASNLGEQMSAGMSNVLSQELDVKRQELAGKVDAITREKMAGFSTMVNDEFKKVTADLNLSEEHAQGLIQRLADNSGVNLDKLGLDKGLDLNKLDPSKLIPKKKIDFKKLFD